jgi:hypothetical protein
VSEGLEDPVLSPVAGKRERGKALQSLRWKIHPQFVRGTHVSREVEL